MSDLYVGERAASISVPPKFDAISKIVLLVDDENYYEAGNDTGRTLEITCPYGTQGMANNILASVSGYQYQPVTATDALADPAVELGDSMTVGGAYSIVAQRDIDFGLLLPMALAAPGQEEIESEYPYVSQQQSDINRQIAQTRSEISKTSEEIGLRVDGLENQYAQLKVTIDGVTIEGPGGTTLIDGGKIDADELHVNAANIDGTLSANQINMTGAITWNDLASDAKGEITDAQDAASAAQSRADSAYSRANSAYNTANDVDDTISAWTYPGTTQIDGREIRTGTVTASTLRGGTVEILTSSESEAGYMSVSGASSASYAIDLISNGALRLQASRGTLHLEGGSGAIIDVNANVDVGADLRPSNDNYLYLGTAALRWREVYAATGTIQTSDRNFKTDIDYDMSRYGAFFDALRPASCKYIDGTSGRRHIVMVSQDVEQELIDSGLTSMDFAGFVKSPMTDKDGNEIDGQYRYFLRYDEFIGLLIWQVQELKKRVAQLEA